VCLFGVANGDAFTQGWVQHVGEQPGKVALGSQVAELPDAKVEVVVLYGTGRCQCLHRGFRHETDIPRRRRSLSRSGSGEAPCGCLQRNCS
jgi:hypothetical protein